MPRSEQQQRDHDELQRLQVGAALVLGIVLLIAILLRAHHGNVLPAGWWRP